MVDNDWLIAFWWMDGLTDYFICSRTLPIHTSVILGAAGAEQWVRGDGKAYKIAASMKQVLSDVNYSVSVSQIWFVLYRWLSQRRVTGIPESPSPSWLRPWAARPLLFIVINYLFNTNTVRSSRYGANRACSYCCTYLLTFAGKTYFFCTSTYEENERIIKFNIG